MHKSEMSPGSVTAMERLDALVHLTGPELGRWMLEIAERLASKGRLCRSCVLDGSTDAQGEARQ